MMSEIDVERLAGSPGVSAWRVEIARMIEAPRAQSMITAAIIANAIVLGLESDTAIRAQHGQVLQALDNACLVLFVVELLLKLAVYRSLFWRNGWNWFDFAVVGCRETSRPLLPSVWKSRTSGQGSHATSWRTTPTRCDG